MRNKIILALTCLFSAFFLFYIFKLSDEIQRDTDIILASPNVINVTDALSTTLMVTDKDLGPESWVGKDSDKKPWKIVKIPSHRIVREEGYKDGSFAYYNVRLPEAEINKLSSLKDQLDLSLYFISFTSFEVFINGKFFKRYTPETEDQNIVIVPVESGRENLISIKGKIKSGDQGLNHRDPILLGKTGELYSIHKSTYKATIVFPLIFILSKGSIIFVFALIYLLLNVERFFEKSLLFSLCAVGEDVLTGEFLTGMMSLSTRVYIYNLLNIGASLFLFLFLADVVNRNLNKRLVYVITAIISVITFAMSFDVLNTGKFFNFDVYLKTWNMVSGFVLLFFIPLVLKKDRVLFFVMSATLMMTMWGTFFAENVGLNFKMLGNLLLFFMVAYQSFALFRRDQLDHQAKQIQLLEQEKDVAIGKTASLLAHDVRRPLEQMKLLLDKVSGGQVTPEFLQAAKRDVDFSITSVNNQINDIMNYSKTRPVVLSEISFYRVLAGSLKQVMTINKNLDIKIEQKFNAQVSIMGDESRLAGALTNLVSNAVEAIRDIGKSQKGVIRLSTSIENNKFIFRIFNDGPSIPENLLEEIFRPLFTHGKEHGTGLGLSSVMKTVQEHAGEISVENNGERGVEFVLAFKPAGTPDSAESYGILNHSRDYSYELKSAPKSSKRPLRIFLLDDDMQVHEYFNHLVTNLPFEIEMTSFSHVDAATEALKSKRFDLYILDYDLGGGKNGADFYRENLSFLSDEVVIHTNRDKLEEDHLKCKLIKKPMTYEDLELLCEKVWSNRKEILLVDDGQLTLMAWEMYHGSHNIHLIDSPEAAIDFVEKKKGKVDICVLDYYFDNSRMNGEALALKLSNLNNQLRIVIASNIEQSVQGFQSIHKTDFEVRSLR